MPRVGKKKPEVRQILEIGICGDRLLPLSEFCPPVTNPLPNCQDWLLMHTILRFNPAFYFPEGEYTEFTRYNTILRITSLYYVIQKEFNSKYKTPHPAIQEGAEAFGPWFLAIYRLCFQIFHREFLPQQNYPSSFHWFISILIESIFVRQHKDFPVPTRSNNPVKKRKDRHKDLVIQQTRLQRKALKDWQNPARKETELWLLFELAIARLMEGTEWIKEPWEFLLQSYKKLESYQMRAGVTLVLNPDDTISELTAKGGRRKSKNKNR